MKRKNLMRWGVPLLGVTMLAGCPQNGDNPAMVSYEVTVTNLTEAQPLSPPGLVLHRDGYTPWQIGSSASDGLEKLAEGGDPTPLLTEAKFNPRVRATRADTAPILPGTSSSIIIEGNRHPTVELSLATMLVNTNDGFTGLAAQSLTNLGLHESVTYEVPAYDAGTEANSESAATVPGPAAGGEGFNSVRDDRNSVGGHPGVVSAGDGLGDSALDVSHRFDNPVARIRITRLE